MHVPMRVVSSYLSPLLIITLISNGYRVVRVKIIFKAREEELSSRKRDTQILMNQQSNHRGEDAYGKLLADMDKVWSILIVYGFASIRPCSYRYHFLP